MGVVEMGGASVQIAFVVPTAAGDDVRGHVFPVHVAGRRYLLYADSYLGLGESSVVDRIKTILDEDAAAAAAGAGRASNVIRNPCMLTGATTSIHTARPTRPVESCRPPVSIDFKM